MNNKKKKNREFVSDSISRWMIYAIYEGKFVSENILLNHLRPMLPLNQLTFFYTLVLFSNQLIRKIKTEFKIFLIYNNFLDFLDLQ